MILKKVCKKNKIKYKYSFLFLDNYELSKTPIPESINDEDENIEFSEFQVKIYRIRN
jgi:hypothetical protein